MSSFPLARSVWSARHNAAAIVEAMVSPVVATVAATSGSMGVMEKSGCIKAPYLPCKTYIRSPSRTSTPVSRTVPAARW